MFFQSDFEFSKKQYDFCKFIYLQTWALRSAFSLEPKVSETQECIGLTWLYIMVIYCCNFQIFIKCIGLLVVLKHHPQVCVCHQNCCSDLPFRRGQNFKTGPKCSLRRILREGSGWDCSSSRFGCQLAPNNERILFQTYTIWGAQTRWLPPFNSRWQSASSQFPYTKKSLNIIQSQKNLVSIEKTSPYEQSSA